MPTLLEIVSPDRLLLPQPVDMAVIPAAEGEMGVLGGHSPMIVLLRGGTITLHEGGQPTARLFVSGGFAEITPDRCTVLADEAVPVADLSRSDAEQRLAAAQQSPPPPNPPAAPPPPPARARPHPPPALGAAAGGRAAAAAGPAALRRVPDRP